MSVLLSLSACCMTEWLVRSMSGRCHQHPQQHPYRPDKQLFNIGSEFGAEHAQHSHQQCRE